MCVLLKHVNKAKQINVSSSHFSHRRRCYIRVRCHGLEQHKRGKKRSTSAFPPSPKMKRHVHDRRPIDFTLPFRLASFILPAQVASLTSPERCQCGRFQSQGKQPVGSGAADREGRRKLLGGTEIGSPYDGLPRFNDHFSTWCSPVIQAYQTT